MITVYNFLTTIKYISPTKVMYRRRSLKPGTERTGPDQNFILGNAILYQIKIKRA